MSWLFKVCKNSTTTSSLLASNVGCSSSSLIQFIPQRNLNSNRASITRIHRLKYLRTYPTLLANPDGSTYTVRYPEPRKIIKLPFDISNLTEEEKRVHLERRRPKTRLSIEDDDVGPSSFDAGKYLNLLKKKK